MWELIIENLHGWCVWGPALYVMQLYLFGYCAIEYERKHKNEASLSDAIGIGLITNFMFLGAAVIILVVVGIFEPVGWILASWLSAIFFFVSGLISLWGIQFSKRMVSKSYVKATELKDKAHERMTEMKMHRKQNRATREKAQALSADVMTAEVSRATKELLDTMPLSWEIGSEQVRLFRDGVIPNLITARQRYVDGIGRLRQNSERQTALVSEVQRKTIEETIAKLSADLEMIEAQQIRTLTFLDFELEAKIIECYDKEDGEEQVIHLIRAFCDSKKIDLNRTDPDLMSAYDEIEQALMRVRKKASASPAEEPDKKALGARATSKAAH